MPGRISVTVPGKELGGKANDKKKYGRENLEPHQAPFQALVCLTEEQNRCSLPQMEGAQRGEVELFGQLAPRGQFSTMPLLLLLSSGKKTLPLLSPFLPFCAERKGVFPRENNGLHKMERTGQVLASNLLAGGGQDDHLAK